MYSMLIFEWDENKNRRNIATHGIDFVQAKEIWGEAVLEIPSPQLRMVKSDV